VHDEPEVGLVEAHAERRRGHECLDLVVEQVLLGGETLGRVGLARVRGDRVALVAQVGGDLLGRGDGERVHDAGAGQLVQGLGEPGEPLLGARRAHHAEVEALPLERAAQHHRGLAELLGDVAGHPGVRGRRGGEDRHARRELREQGAQAAVVGAEVMAPVGDAVGLVHDHEPGALGELGQHAVAEVGVVEPFRADEQDVDLARGDVGVDGLPLLEVRRVDRRGVDAGPLGGGDLVAHERQQRRDDHGRSLAELPQQRRGDEVHGRLAPAGPLHHQYAPALDDERLDRGPLVVAQPRVLPGERPQPRFGLLAQRLTVDVHRGEAGPVCEGPVRHRPRILFRVRLAGERRRRLVGLVGELVLRHPSLLARHTDRSAQLEGWRAEVERYGVRYAVHRSVCRYRPRRRSGGRWRTPVRTPELP